MSADESTEPQTTELAKVIRIHGPATPEEVAAVVSVLSAAAGRPTARTAPAPSRWGHPSELIRRRLQPGQDAWFYSARPMEVMG